MRSRLQSKGTRGAKSRLRPWQLRERRFKADVNHRIAKTMVEPGFLIGLEDLTPIRERTKTQGKQHNCKRAKWALAELGAFVASKSQSCRRVSHPGGCGLHLPGLPELRQRRG